MKHFNPRSPHGERLQGIFSRRSSSTISIHAPRTGSDCSTSSVPSSPIRFQSTLPARGATFVAVFRERGDLISIHAPRTGSDQSATRRAGAGAYFNPRSPHGERRTHGMQWHVWTTTFQSTLPARGATRPALYTAIVKAFISIHAPRTGSDDVALLAAEADADFNPRSPHGERQKKCLVVACALIFQSTLPARGATTVRQAARTRPAFQSTLPARGATTAGSSSFRRASLFQSTLPARGATLLVRFPARRSQFQSTLPARGATLGRKKMANVMTHFNPRSPHGERRYSAGVASYPGHFNPRSPHGERHVRVAGNEQVVAISIHAPRTGSDKRPLSTRFAPLYFNPRSPHGERREGRAPLRNAGRISIHAPRTGSDKTSPEPSLHTKEFQSTLPARGATLAGTPCLRCAIHFNPRSPHGERHNEEE